MKTKEVGAEEPYSYMSVLFNAAAYVIYGIPVFADKTNKPVMLANGVGVLFELAYVLLFIVYVAADRRPCDQPHLRCGRNHGIAWTAAWHGRLRARLDTHVHGLGRDVLRHRDVSHARLQNGN